MRGKKLLESVATGIITDIALMYHFFLTTDIIIVLYGDPVGERGKGRL